MLVGYFGCWFNYTEAVTREKQIADMIQHLDVNFCCFNECFCSSAHVTRRWQHVLEYSNQIFDLLGGPKLPSGLVIEDPRMILQVILLQSLLQL